MRQIIYISIVYFGCFHSLFSSAQILKSNGKYLELVDEKDPSRKIIEQQFSSCFCTDYVDAYMIKEYPDSTYKPILNQHGQIILKDTLGYWNSFSPLGEHILTFSPNESYAPEFFNDSQFAMNTSDSTYIYHLDGSLIYSIKRAGRDSYGDVVLKANSKKKYGLVNHDGDEILPFDFVCTSWDAKNFSFNKNGLVSLKNSAGKCGVVNHGGETIIPFEYDYIDDLHFEHNYLQKDGRWGTVDIFGNKLVPMIYEELPYPTFNDSDRNPVKVDGVWYVADKNLNAINSKKYDYFNQPKIDTKGGWHMSTAYIVKEQGKGYALFDLKKLKNLSAAKYDTIFSSQGELVAISKKTTDTFDEFGKKLTSIKNKKYQRLDDNGNEISRGERYIAIDKNKKGLSTSDGTILIETKYQKIVFIEGFFICELNDKKFLHDIEGKLLYSGEFDDMIIHKVLDKDYNEINHFIIILDEKMGILNEKMELLLPIEYDQICPYRYLKNIIAHKGETAHFFNEKGELESTKTIPYYGNPCSKYSYKD